MDPHDRDRHRLLIVEDDCHALEALGELLRDEGFEVAEATSGEQALLETEKFRPDLAMIDVRMPGMDGIELLHRLRSLEPTLVAMMMTTEGSQSTRRRTRQLGWVHVVDKPLVFSSLVTHIRTALEEPSFA